LSQDGDGMLKTFFLHKQIVGVKSGEREYADAGFGHRRNEGCQHTDEQLPTVQTLTSKLNVLGFRLTKVAKWRPQK